MGHHRRMEFIAGRAIAKKAMASLGVADEVITRDSFGCPCWPASVVGSISHKGGLCGALVAPKTRYKSVGFDIEFVEGLDKSIWTSFTSDEELDACLIKDLSEDYIANILFCTKEACFKALFPLFKADTPPFRSIIPIRKVFQNQLDISFYHEDIFLSGGVVWDARAILSWILATKKV
jgi:4'-phosphopantetheinyl transferase EntD